MNERLMAALEMIAPALANRPQLPAADSADSADRFLTVKEAAERYGLSESHIGKAHKDERLNIYHLPSVRGDRVSQAEMQTYVASISREQFIKPRTKKRPATKAKAAKGRSK